MSARLLTAALALGVAVLAGCNTSLPGTGALSGVPTGGPPAPTSGSGTPTPSGGPQEPLPPEVAVFDIGETGTVTDELGNPLADITLADAAQTAQPPDEFSDPPENGTFLSVTVTVANIGGEVFTVAPLDFVVHYADGTRVEYGAGSSGVFGYDDMLESNDLEPAQTVSGVVAFDVDPAAAGKQILYTGLAGRVLGAWNVP